LGNAESTPVHNIQKESCYSFDLGQFKDNQFVDQVPRILAHGLSWALKAADSAVRIGGGEFVVVLPGPSVQVALAVARRT